MMLTPDGTKVYGYAIFTCALCHDGKEFRGNGAYNSHWAKHERQFARSHCYRFGCENTRKKLHKH